MSIIYDALKKVKPKTEEVKGYLEPIRQETSRIRLIGIVVTVALVFIFLITLLNKTSKEKPEPPISLATSTSLPHLTVETKTTHAQQALPVRTVEEGLFAQAEESGFSVTGIFFSDDQFWALINDKIVKVGDSISGAHIDKIDFGGVDITFKNSSFRLEYP